MKKLLKKRLKKIIKVEVDPLIGLLPFQARDVGFQLGLKDKQISQFVTIMTGAYKAFVENDFALFEINPLSVRENGEILCVDAKVGIDSNALYRLPEIAAMRDKSQENERELKASEFDLNYVALERQYWLYGKWCRSCNGNNGYHQNCMVVSQQTSLMLVAVQPKIASLKHLKLFFQIHLYKVC